ncbi:MAG TPA: hypothetical protein VM120_25570 [Bryobacteraceae bacterium]|nr:hypothetical protein [Bryobacteraceae bacterium]
MYRFANSALTPLSHHRRHWRYIGLSVGGGRVFLTLARESGSIWIGQFDK